MASVIRRHRALAACWLVCRVHKAKSPTSLIQTIRIFDFGPLNQLDLIRIKRRNASFDRAALANSTVGGHTRPHSTGTMQDRTNATNKP